MTENFTELAFSESVKTQQEKYGTRAAYERMERGGAFRNRLTWQERAFIAGRDGFYLASAGESGWPYVQFRGGPQGFLNVLDDNTLAFADFRGNGQYISSGNLRAGGKAVLFLMDYARQKRLKIWAEAEVLDAANEPETARRVTPSGYGARVERVFVFKVLAFDWNCPQHITPRFTRKEIDAGLAAETKPATP